jgi:hypothetical protein
MDCNYKEIISKYKYKFFRQKHVVGVGYGIKEKEGKKTDKKAIIILVNKKVPEKKLSNRDLVSQKVGSHKTDVIEIGDIQFLNIRTERVRPIQPGVSIGHHKISAGTLGAIVKDKKTGNPLLLSNNHVLANITNGRDGRAQKGDPILQPGVYDNGNKEDVVGHLERFIPIKKNDEMNCPIARGMESLSNIFLNTVRPDYSVKLFKMGVENIVDCAVAKPVNKEIVNPEVLEIGKVKGIKSPKVGMEVKKSGRTTGLTTSNIKVIDASIEVKMSENESTVFTDQIILEPFSSAGDSGSLILDEEDNAVGLLFAGSDKATVGNNIENVLDQLEIGF